MKMINVKILNTLSLFILISFASSATNLFGQTLNTAAKVNPLIDSKRLLRDIKFLSFDEMKGRAAGTLGNAMARIYITKRFKESGLEHFGGKYTQEFSFKNQDKKKTKGVNVIGFIKGKSKPDKYIVITAHYDHLGDEDEKIYNGADDNASGTAALFALAAHFKRDHPAHTLIFVAFDAEEEGLHGSNFFVKNLPVKKRDVLLNINLDMISRNDKKELYVAGMHHYPFLKKYIEPFRKKSKIKLLYGHDTPALGHDDWTNASDHAPFHRAKIPFAYFGVEDHEDYHKPTDVFENIDQKFYVDVVETILIITKHIDKNYKKEKK